MVRPYLAGAFALALALNASGAELPKPLAEGERAETVAKWRKAFDAKFKATQAKLDEAIATLKKDLTNTTAVVERDTARFALEEMKKNPLAFGEGVFAPIGRTDVGASGRAKVGQIGTLLQPVGTVVDVVPDGALFEVTHAADSGETGDPKPTRYLLVGSVPNAKKGAKVTVSGLWHYAGDAEVGGAKVAVLRAFLVKPAELPKFAGKK